MNVKLVPRPDAAVENQNRDQKGQRNGKQKAKPPAPAIVPPAEELEKNFETEELNALPLTTEAVVDLLQSKPAPPTAKVLSLFKKGQSSK